MADFIAWHGKTLAQHLELANTYKSQGYGFISLSVYGSVASPFYATVMLRPAAAAQHHYPAMDGLQWERTFDSEAAQGYGPVIIAATGSASSPLFAAVFEPQNPIPLTRHGLGRDTIQQMNAQAKTQGLILRWAAAYGDSIEPRFAAIWVPNLSKSMWNADGMSDSGSDYQSRFNAQTSQWCRPAFVTLNSAPQYLSLFVDTEVAGGWYARHGMSADDYQTEFNKANANGFFPVCVQAAAPFFFPWVSTFAAIFVKSRGTVQKVFTPTGPVVNASIDNVIQQAMASGGPVRHASLAIVHGTQLVYARGYTLAEPDWPTVQPTTCFRLASVSKTPTALAIFQLMEEGKLKSDGSDLLQDILNLKTPTGGPPPDPNFKFITIKNLLEHKSCLNPDAFGNGVAVRNAFGTSATLPVSAEMTDSYVASLPLLKVPPVYNNCGYYLLGRVVAKLRKTARPIDAYQNYLFNPLSIARIRRARSLVADQPRDEARYQDPNLNVFQSQMTQSQPLVPAQYGSGQLEICEGQGGLSGAATDVARLVAILISQKDNPALKRSTLKSMLSAGATLTAAGSPRAGYGFDELYQSPSNPHGLGVLGSGQFYGQKGGNLAVYSKNYVQSVLQFDGDWGFVMLWASDVSSLAPPSSNWYPDYPAVMNTAKAASWGSADLFPQFGMPSLF